jgi:chemotaxis protein methyltransferase CheR
MSDIKTFLGVRDVGTLAQAIVDTVAEPLVVLDRHLRVITASRSFYLTFQVNRQNTQGRLLYDLGEGQWNIAELRLLLERVLTEHGVVEAYEVAREFPGLGWRTMRLSARKVLYEDNPDPTLLLTIADVTELRAIEQEMKELMWQKELLLEEMQHRVANSLTIIASILMLKARTVQSEETRQHLQDAHCRVMSVAAVQNQLHSAGQITSIEIASYLTRLCEALAESMIGESRPISLKVAAAEGRLPSKEAVSIGLLVTELVINALKHAFPAATRAGRVDVAYEAAGNNWKLSISDNGIGVPDANGGRLGQKKAGLGTSIVQALAQQLEAEVDVVSSPAGTIVSITHATFAAGQALAEDRSHAGHVPGPSLSQNVFTHVARGNSVTTPPEIKAFQLIARPRLNMRPSGASKAGASAKSD